MPHTGRDEDDARRLLDQLLADSRLYARSADYKALLDFVAKLRNFAPFNAMLLHIQKPGLRFAASASDWLLRFGRRPKEAARPLLILWPFGPVALVYDAIDTEGDPLPQDVAAFAATGAITEQQFSNWMRRLDGRKIACQWMDAGDQSAGWIRVLHRPADKNDPIVYRLMINRNHDLAVRFITLAHELAHLFLGHLGPDHKLRIRDRIDVPIDHRELEAESVAFILSERIGVKSKSETYLVNYISEKTTIDDIDLYTVMRAAGQVEDILGLKEHLTFGAKQDDS